MSTLDSKGVAVEAYLFDIAPSALQTCEGASEQEIAALQAVTSYALPSFYLWFLRTMGRNMGTLAFTRVDFSIGAVLAFYENEDERDTTDRYLVIGLDRGNDIDGRMYVYYDFSKSTPVDAAVCHDDGPVAGMDSLSMFESFGTMLAWSEARYFHVDDRASTCTGSIRAVDGDVTLQLDALTARLGFVQRVQTGRHCRVYERADATITAFRGPRSADLASIAFDLGANSEAIARVLLGAIGTAPGLSVKVRDWLR